MSTRAARGGQVRRELYEYAANHHKAGGASDDTPLTHRLSRRRRPPEAQQIGYDIGHLIIGELRARHAFRGLQIRVRRRQEFPERVRTGRTPICNCRETRSWRVQDRRQVLIRTNHVAYRANREGDAPAGIDIARWGRWFSRRRAACLRDQPAYDSGPKSYDP